MNRNDRAIVGVLLPAHGLIHTYELSIPLFVAVWLDQFAVTEASIGLIVATGYVLFGVGALPGGILSDTYESRPLVIASMGGMAGSFLMLSLSPSAVGVAVALVVWGLAASVYHPAALSLISRGVKQRGSAFAYHGMAGNVGTALGPFVTAVLLLFVDWRLAVAVLGAVGVVATVAATRATFDERAATEEGLSRGDQSETGTTATGPEERGPPETIGEFVSASRTLFASSFLLVFLAVLLSGLYYRGIFTFLPDLLTVPGPAAFGVTGVELDSSRYLYTGLLMVGVLGQYAGGKLTDRLPPRVRPYRWLRRVDGARARVRARDRVSSPVSRGQCGARIHPVRCPTASPVTGRQAQRRRRAWLVVRLHLPGNLRYRPTRRRHRRCRADLSLGERTVLPPCGTLRGVHRRHRGVGSTPPHPR